MTTVVALGGNALARRGETIDVETQRRNIASAAMAVTSIAHRDWVVLAHGNGPQVGLLAMQSEAVAAVRPYPLDVLDAESEGMIGYLLEQELGRQRSADLVATLLTQVVVDPHDPAFIHPTKPIGPVLERARGEALARERGWVLTADGHGVRRVVASPEPHDIVELHAIRLLLGAGVLVIAGGGGGIPVIELPAGGYTGVEAVVDKDLTAALLATKLGAKSLVMLTDVDAVYDGWGTDAAAAIRRAGVETLRNRTFAAGSMGPKVEAGCRVGERGGRALIGSLDDVDGLLSRTSGTEVVPGDEPIAYW